RTVRLVLAVERRERRGRGENQQRGEQVPEWAWANPVPVHPSVRLLARPLAGGAAQAREIPCEALFTFRVGDTIGATSDRDESNPRRNSGAQPGPHRPGD